MRHRLVITRFRHGSIGILECVVVTWFHSIRSRLQPSSSIAKDLGVHLLPGLEYYSSALWHLRRDVELCLGSQQLAGSVPRCRDMMRHAQLVGKHSHCNQVDWPSNVCNGSSPQPEEQRFFARMDLTNAPFLPDALEQNAFSSSHVPPTPKNCYQMCWSTKLAFTKR